MNEKIKLPFKVLDKSELFFTKEEKAVVSRLASFFIKRAEKINAESDEPLYKPKTGELSVLEVITIIHTEVKNNPDVLFAEKFKPFHLESMMYALEPNLKEFKIKPALKKSIKNKIHTAVLFNDVFHKNWNEVIEKFESKDKKTVRKKIIPKKGKKEKSN